MIDKVIIAEDQESSNLSIQKTMEDLCIKHSDYVYYCDDALNKIQAARQKGRPYDLLITDLSFEADGTFQKIGGGLELIHAVRAVQPEIMILVFTAEGRPSVVDNLFKNYEIDAYVRKARHDVKELKSAFAALSKGERYYPRALAQVTEQVNTYEFTELDINIIRLISEGIPQKEIPDYIPKSLSTIEKKLKQIRDEFGFVKNEQLVLFCKEAGIL